MMCMQLINSAWLCGIKEIASYSAVCVLVTQSCQLYVTPWTVVCQAPLSMECSRQEYWSGLPFSSPGDFPDPEIEPMSATSPELAGWFFSLLASREAPSPPCHNLRSCFHLKTQSSVFCFEDFLVLEQVQQLTIHHIVTSFFYQSPSDGFLCFKLLQLDFSVSTSYLLIKQERYILLCVWNPWVLLS